jgi:glycerol-3-phosphate dehydrogenase (NAD(P)+)
MKITVVGTGGWGTALALLLHGNGHQVTLWGRMAEEVNPILETRENKLFLPGVPLPQSLTVTMDMAAATDAELVVMAVPSHGMRAICKMFPKGALDGRIIVSVAKGIENDTAALMSQVIHDELATDKIVVLSGPSHAEEVGRGVPTAVVVASQHPSLAEKAQQAFMSDRFRVYTHDDVTGVELGGALKNVIAIAAGACDGIGFGDNTKAALCTRGLAEMARLGNVLGANPQTFYGLSGIGDLIVTAFSRHSRNRGFGERLGRGESAEQILGSVHTVAEGVKTSRSIHQLIGKHCLDLPISRQVYAVVYEGKNPREAVRDIMSRDAKPEFD